jgi:nicotinate-nucleotide adenylyltransferase
MPSSPSWLPTPIRSLLVYGGSFDPIHNAHLTLPELVRSQIGADLIAYIPAAAPPHKQAQGRTPGHHRLAMLRLALKDNPRAVVLTHELDRALASDRPSYTVDTLESLIQELGPSVKLHLLMGADMLAIFPKWHRYQRILELAQPVVMVRPPADKAFILGALPPGLAAADWQDRIMQVPPSPISSTLIRQRVAHHQPLTDLVPPSVEQYIQAHKLYQ